MKGFRSLPYSIGILFAIQAKNTELRAAQPAEYLPGFIGSLRDES
jgi:hypothetical protein